MHVWRTHTSYFGRRIGTSETFKTFASTRKFVISPFFVDFMLLNQQNKQLNGTLCDFDTESIDSLGDEQRKQLVGRPSPSVHIGGNVSLIDNPRSVVGTVLGQRPIEGKHPDVHSSLFAVHQQNAELVRSDHQLRFVLLQLAPGGLGQVGTGEQQPTNFFVGGDERVRLHVRHSVGPSMLLALPLVQKAQQPGLSDGRLCSSRAASRPPNSPRGNYERWPPSDTPSSVGWSRSAVHPADCAGTDRSPTSPALLQEKPIELNSATTWQRLSRFHRAKQGAQAQVAPLVLVGVLVIAGKPNRPNVRGRLRNRALRSDRTIP